MQKTVVVSHLLVVPSSEVSTETHWSERLKRLLEDVPSVTNYGLSWMLCGDLAVKFHASMYQLPHSPRVDILVSGKKPRMDGIDACTPYNWGRRYRAHLQLVDRAALLQHYMVFDWQGQQLAVMDELLLALTKTFKIGKSGKLHRIQPPSLELEMLNVDPRRIIQLAWRLGLPIVDRP